MTATMTLFGARAQRSRRLLGAVILGVLGLSIFSTGVASASPARYVFEMCDSALPNGGVSGVRYAQSPGQPWSPADNCEAPGGSLEIRQVGSIGPGGSATWALPIEPPPGGTMESTSVSAEYCPEPGTYAYIFYPGWPPSGCYEENRVFRVPEDFRAFDVELQCSENCPAGALIYARDFATIEVDPVAPTLGTLEGTLLGGGVIRGHQTLGAEARDQGGGVASVSVNVNSLPAAQPKVSNCDVAQTSNASAQGTVAAAITPCPTKVNASWTIDTEAFPFHSGVNTVQVCGSDFATLGDPNTTCSPTKSVNVDDSCAESPVSGGEVLSASFSQSNAETVTVKYGEGAAVQGTLDTNAGDPVPGATICVKQKSVGSEPAPVNLGVVRTDAEGRYTYQVPPGPNRELMVGYRHDANQVARDVRYYSHTEPTLMLAPTKVRNGQRIKLWGSVPEPDASGRVVVLQASAPGSKRWLTFRKATSGPKGNFASHYRFAHTTRSTTYRIRAVVPDQAGYPWVGGAGKAVRVRVSR